MKPLLRRTMEKSTQADENSKRVEDPARGCTAVFGSDARGAGGSSGLAARPGGSWGRWRWTRGAAEERRGGCPGSRITWFVPTRSVKYRGEGGTPALLF